jgi:hypothetical protein
MSGQGHGTPPRVFSQVFILQALKVICFDGVLQVFILNRLELTCVTHWVSRVTAAPMLVRLITALYYNILGIEVNLKRSAIHRGLERSGIRRGFER